MENLRDIQSQIANLANNLFELDLWVVSYLLTHIAEDKALVRQWFGLSSWHISQEREFVREVCPDLHLEIQIFWLGRNSCVHHGATPICPINYHPCSWPQDHDLDLESQAF